METFLFTKDIKPIRATFFDRGITIPVALHEKFSEYLSGGRLYKGESRKITIFLGGVDFEVSLRSIGFTNPNRGEEWQINWSAGHNISKKLKQIFAKFYADSQGDREYFVLYATDVKDTFCMEPIFNHEIVIPKMSELALENLLELPTLTDTQAEFVERFGLTKYRKLNRELGERLKRNYNYRCQICGLDVGELYGAQVCDCHHINYFSVSLDNTASNLLIVCPNHHRIIHAANPTFDRARKIFLYPNGLEEILRLNEHL